MQILDYSINFSLDNLVRHYDNNTKTMALNHTTIC